VSCVVILQRKVILHKTRPFGVTALTVLFLFGTVASFISVVSLTFPGSFLEAIWQLNPHAREAFARIGLWAILLMSIVCIACACAVIGLWRGFRWGFWLAVGMLLVNLASNLFNVISGVEPRSIVGIPIVLFLLAYLVHRRTRNYFRQSTVV
jgi:hypothetical protein